MWNFFLLKKNNYHQIGNDYLEFDIRVRKSDGRNLHYDGPIRLVKNSSAFCFKEASLITALGSDIEHNKFCGQISTFMRVISNKDGDLSFQFDNINENDMPILERLQDLPTQILDTPHKKC